MKIDVKEEEEKRALRLNTQPVFDDDERMVISGTSTNSQMVENQLLKLGQKLTPRQSNSEFESQSKIKNYI